MAAALKGILGVLLMELLPFPDQVRVDFVLTGGLGDGFARLDFIDWDLFAANADEREGAQELLENSRDLCVLGDKGFLDRKRQSVLQEDQGLLLLTPKRRNQQEQNAPAWDTLMNRARRLIETTFAQAKGTFGLEKPGARTVWGILSRVIAKITGLTLAAKSNREQGHSPLRLVALHGRI